MSQKNIVHCVISVMLSFGSLTLILVSVLLFIHCGTSIGRASLVCSFLVNCGSIFFSGIGLNEIANDKPSGDIAVSFNQQAKFILYSFVCIIVAFFFMQ